MYCPGDFSGYFLSIRQPFFIRRVYMGESFQRGINKWTDKMQRESQQNTWNPYLLLKDVHEKFHKDILVPMTLLRRESFRIIERLLQDGIDTRLVVLEASYQTAHDRILARGEEEGCWCMENIELARAGSAALPGIHIQTDGKPVVELCNEVLNQMCWWY